jgi:hypothetical protein
MVPVQSEKKSTSFCSTVKALHKLASYMSIVQYSKKQVAEATEMSGKKRVSEVTN